MNFEYENKLLNAAKFIEKNFDKEIKLNTST